MERDKDQKPNPSLPKANDRVDVFFLLQRYPKYVWLKDIVKSFFLEFEICGYSAVAIRKGVGKLKKVVII